MRRLIAALIVIAVVGGGAAVAWNHVGGVVEDLITEPQDCTAVVDGMTATLSHEQAHYASLIAAIGVQRGLPARAVTIALATAMQESKLHNIDYGDRDSVGLFQQRTSQGWGTVEQIMDPTYSTNAFYDELERHDFTSMEVTDAAQAVQRSGFPLAYAQHEAEARVLASALTGWSPHAFTCNQASSSEPEISISDAVEQQFETTVVVRGELSYLTPANRRIGWAMAHWAVANADRTGLRAIEYRGQRWTADEGWQRSGSRSKVLKLRSA